MLSDTESQTAAYMKRTPCEVLGLFYITQRAIYILLST